MELNEHTTPPNGWQYYQPETKWRAPTPIASTLNQTVMLLIAHRKKNPAIVAKFKLSTTPEVVKSEVLRFNRKRLGMPEEQTPTPFQAPHSTSRSAAGGAVGLVRSAESSMSGLKRAAQGTAVVIDWLGSGANPVDQQLAEKRSAICLACPKNQPGEWFTVAPAELIKKSVEAWKTMTGRKDFEFRTEHGNELQSCAICKCLNRLKVFVPLSHIITKTKSEVMGEFPPNCWIKQEQA